MIQGMRERAAVINKVEFQDYIAVLQQNWY